jgi:pimeloyl-ACP methyl ester carboxylesterase
MNLSQNDVTAPDGATLNVWERAPDDADEAVLFVHGIITNARGLFATPVEDDTSYSWVHGASDRGRAAFAMDQRGYGDSDQLPAMDEPPEANGPPNRAAQAADDIGVVVDWLHEEFDAVHLVGVSWGSHTSGYYLSHADVPVDSLVHCAPVYKPAYDFQTGLDALGIDDYDVGWFEQDRETVRARSDHPNHVFKAIWQSQVESNQGIDDDRFKVQAGGIADWADSVAGDPVWDPAHIDVPTMVFYGGEDQLADRQGSLACYDRLTHTDSEYVELAGVDHYMMHGERRQDVFELTSDFQDRVA